MERTNRFVAERKQQVPQGQQIPQGTRKSNDDPKQQLPHPCR